MYASPFQGRLIVEPSVIRFKGYSDDVRSELCVKNCLTQYHIAFTVDSTPNADGQKVITCLPRWGYVEPTKSARIQLFTQVLNAEERQRINASSHIVNVQYRLLTAPPRPIDPPHSVFYRAYTPLHSIQVPCFVDEPETNAQQSDMDSTDASTDEHNELNNNDFLSFGFSHRPSI